MTSRRRLRDLAGPDPKRKVPISRRLILPIVAAVLASASVSAAHPESSPSKGHPATRDGLSVTFHIHRAHVLYRSAYALERWQVGPKRSDIRKAQVHKRAIRIAKVRGQLAEFRDRQAAKLRAYAAEQRQIAALTPYPGPGGTRWAVPYYIVACESGGDWGAYNPSGAAGAYQIMPEWGRPWPITSEADKLAHHRIAAQIWNGGAGAGNWECA